MVNQVIFQQPSKFISFLAIEAARGAEFLPSLSQLSETLGVSVSSLREDLQVARSMGLV